MSVHGVLAEHESSRDLVISQPLGDQPENLLLPRGEAPDRPLATTRFVASLRSRRPGALVIGSEAGERLHGSARQFACRLARPVGSEDAGEFDACLRRLERQTAGIEQIDGILEGAASRVVVAYGGRHDPLGEGGGRLERIRADRPRKRPELASCRCRRRVVTEAGVSARQELEGGRALCRVERWQASQKAVTDLHRRTRVAAIEGEPRSSDLSDRMSLRRGEQRVPSLPSWS